MLREDIRNGAQKLPFKHRANQSCFFFLQKKKKKKKRTLGLGRLRRRLN